MSGPATAAFSFVPLGAVTLAAMALREAQQMGLEYQDALADMQGRASELAEAQRQSRHARFAQLQATRAQLTQLEAHLEHLRGVCTTLGLEHAAILDKIPGLGTATPQDAGQAAMQQQLESLQAAATLLEQAIAAQQARTPRNAAEAELPLTDPPPLEDALHTYVQQRALQAQLDERQAQAMRDLVERLLARLVLAPDDPLPADIDAASRAIALAPTLERAEALAVDLRLRIQQHNAQREQEAAALVLEQSLRDLGYVVEGVSDTFFVEGGVAHFQRHGWDEYFVRLRLNAQDRTFNFNVVRAKGAQDTAERKRLDYLAEDRWCREFPKLLETLAARGIALDVKRLLGAGELPVQAVDPASLPAAQSQTESRQQTRPAMRRTQR
ncbi:MAG: hypothetical protein IPH35_09750 [Rhodoferax sp.]|nr:hypothetical protein [Rhodoferax sp.]